jgi:hypothetical protein
MIRAVNVNGPEGPGLEAVRHLMSRGLLRAPSTAQRQVRQPPTGLEHSLSGFPGCGCAVTESVDEQCDLPLRVAAAVFLGGQGQIACDEQQVFGIDVGADLAGFRRGVEERAEDRYEALLEAGEQGFVGRPLSAGRC